MEHAALDGAGVFHPDHHAGEHVLEHARRRKIIGRADFTQVGEHRVARLRAVDREAGHQRLRQREQAVADPRHRQVGQDVFAVGQPVEADPAGAGRQQRGVGLHHAFRFAGGAGGVQDDGRVRALARFDGGVEPARVGQVPGASQLLQLRQRHHAGVLVVAHAALVLVDDMAHLRAQFGQFEQLVDLLLVFHHGEGDGGVVQHVGHVGRRRVLVQRHRHAADALRRQHRPVQARTVVADDGQVHAAPETERGEAAGQRAHLGVDLEPAPGLPDAEVLFAKCRPRRAQFPVCAQAARKSLQLRGVRCVHPVSL